MLSVIIPTCDSERPLVSTLVALVPGAIAGLISEVVVADAGSRDDTETVADVAGCNFLLLEGPLGSRLRAAAMSARAPWLLFLRPGTVLDAPWAREVSQYVECPSPDTVAAVFRRGVAAQSTLREALSLVVAALGGKPRPEQGLIIAKGFYEKMGGHSEGCADPEADLLQRLGRRRIAKLSAGAFQARQTARQL